MKKLLFVTIFCLPVAFAARSEAVQPSAFELYQRMNNIRETPNVCGREEPASLLRASRKLEEAARHRAAGKPLGEALNLVEYGAPYAKVLVVGGASVNQAMERLRQRHCQDIVNPHFVDVGALWAKNRWWIVFGLAQNEPVPQDVLKRVASRGDAIQSDPVLFLDLINQARSQLRFCGDKYFNSTQPVAWNPKLASAAMHHSMEVAANKQLSHTGSDGSDVGIRVRREDYDYQAVGENIAMNPFGASATVDSWLNSPGHCANIMSPEYTELGAGSDGAYSVLVFGRR